MRKAPRIAFVLMVLTGLPASAPACISELTLSFPQVATSNTTENVLLDVRGMWACEGDPPVLRDFTVDGRRIRVYLETAVESYQESRQQFFSVELGLGPLEPGENRVELYFDDTADDDPPRLRSVRLLDVQFSCLSRTAFSVSPSAPRVGDVVTVGVEGTWCRGGLRRVDVEQAGSRIRFNATASLGGITGPAGFAMEHEAGPLPAGAYTLELAVDVAEIPGARFQLAATDTFEVTSVCEPPPPQEADFTEPGATLLVPYFDVDLENPGGANTLITVNNTGKEAVLANVVTWTDWGVPSYAFTLYLAAETVQVVDLRGLFEGRVPETGRGFGVPVYGCQDPVVTPPVDVAALRAMHTGTPLPGSGLCAGSPREDAHVAVGFVTVDVVRFCSDTVTVPGDKGYFAADGTGRAAQSNVLWGDVLYVRPDDDSAQGINAVSIPAAPELFAGEPRRETFYGAWVGDDASDARLPLPKSHRMRLLNGGDLGMRTSFLVWSEGRGRNAPTACGGRPFGDGLSLTAVIRDPQGRVVDGLRNPSPAQAARVDIGPVPFDTSVAFGQIDVSMRKDTPLAIPGELLQTWVLPVLTADGRFSVAYEATPLAEACRRQSGR